MKRKFFYVLGGLALMTGSVFAGRASVKTTATSIYAKNINGTGACQAVATGSISANVDTSIGVGEVQARIRSAGSTQYNLFQNADCTNDVKFL